MLEKSDKGPQEDKGFLSKKILGRFIFNVTLGLLFFAQGETNSHMGYLGKDPSQWNQLYKANLTKAEQEIVEKEFNREIDGCYMDTIARIYPHKLKRVPPDNSARD